MSETSKIKLEFLDKLKNNKKLRIIFAIVLSLILALIIRFTLNTEQDAKPTGSAESYVYDLECKLENTLSKIKGVGDVSVIIKVESGMETVIAKETIVKTTQNGTETTEKPVLVNGKTVTLKELYPKITGVLIVAEGAGNIMIKQKIQQATTSLLDVEINNIEILSMN